MCSITEVEEKECVVMKRGRDGKEKREEHKDGREEKWDEESRRRYGPPEGWDDELTRELSNFTPSVWVPARRVVTRVRNNDSLGTIDLTGDNFDEIIAGIELDSRYMRSRFPNEPPRQVLLEVGREEEARRRRRDFHSNPNSLLRYRIEYLDDIPYEDPPNNQGPPGQPPHPPHPPRGPRPPR